MKVYFISGLGADERAFQKLVFPQSWTISHLQWIEAARGESLASYVARFSKLIDSSVPFALVGLSFGGIVSIELNKIIKPLTTILLSSIKTKNELPFSYRMVALLNLHKVVPSFLLNKVYLFTDWYFGTSSTQEKALLREIIHDTPVPFLKWAIHEIVNWQNETIPDNTFHIHGTNDRIFPIGQLKVDVRIADGGHFMVYSKPEEVNRAIINLLRPN
jgi:pimeloyl-ACP methyl ester carboxylesterase